MQVEPYAGAMGGLVSGVNLFQDINAETYEFLHQALLDYEVLFFRDQPMSPENHANLANLFGRPQLHQAYAHVDGFPQLTILENDRDNPSRHDFPALSAAGLDSSWCDHSQAGRRHVVRQHVGRLRGVV